MKLYEIANCLETLAPVKLQESYDNSGLLIGDKEKDISKALITLDVTDQVVEEAIRENCDLIIAHHPIIFKGIKRLTGQSLVEKLVVRLIKEDIAVYAIHTNLDNVKDGVNGMLAKKLGLVNTRILSPTTGNLSKLVTFCPTTHVEQLRSAIFSAGAGHIGNYDSCSFNTSGEGSFRALEGADPFVGKAGNLHFENEIRIETIVPNHKLGKTVSAMIEAHPYEEVAYDIYPLSNTNTIIGAGMMGETTEPLDTIEFLKFIKKVLQSKAIRFSPPQNRKIRKIAICGGSGSFLISAAYKAGADLFLSADIKYHDFFDYHGEMTIVDAGHYETEQFTKELIHSILKKNFPTFALLISNINTNPVDVL